MKKIFIMFILILHSKIGICVANANESQNQANQRLEFINRVNGLEQKITDIKLFDEKAFNTAVTLASNADSNIANKISIMSLLLGFFSFLIIIGGGIIVWYVKEAKKDIIKAKNESFKTMNEIQEFMLNNSETLYKKIIDKDTEKLVERIGNNHRDAINVSALLSVRDITGEKNFKGLLQAYKIGILDHGLDQYEFNISPLLSLIYQHYSEKITSHLNLFCTDKSLFFCRQIGFFQQEILSTLRTLLSDNLMLDNPDLANIIIWGIFCNCQFIKEFKKDVSRDEIICLLKDKISQNEFFKNHFKTALDIAAVGQQGQFKVIFQLNGQTWDPFQPKMLRGYLESIYNELYNSSNDL